MENIEKICFQGLKLQNKLLANMISTSFPGSFVFPPEREWAKKDPGLSSPTPFWVGGRNIPGTRLTCGLHTGQR